MSPELIGVIGIVLLLVLILLRVSVGLSLFLVGFLGVAWLSDWNVGLSQLGTSAFGTAKNYSLSVIPLFILMGMFMSNTGLGKDLFQAVDKWIGHFRGGLAIATIGAASIFAAISGSSNATTATLAKITIPEMKEYNYKTTFSTAAVAAGGTLGILIPPSVILILYGALTNEPIGPLLIGGLIPGVIMTILFMLMINIQVRLNPSIAPRKKESTPFKEKMSSLRGVWPFLVIFFISIGGIYFGVFTPSEAGGIGAVGAFLLTLFTKRLNWTKLYSSLDESIRLTVMLFLILIGASLFGKFLALSQIPMYLTSTVGSLDVSPYLIMAMILVVYFILGMFMEGIAIMVLTLPIVYPLITQLGFDGLWFGIIMVMVLNIGVLTPPLGLSIYIISGVVRDVPIEKIFKGVIPAIVTMIIFTIILVIFPEIVTFLPNMIQ
ncbi:TRAP transporter large permease [Robertmurraya yapensis]|uniref:TRAP transporter large permease n=2 Tax=Bacillaceae TaxID=186817 RepID=A0A431W9X6_9BACI|nr:TRAP transporter large permease [Bacillus yapensis]RTR32303.1 TRAP transporter large permease [Bacillus yapensis]TKS96497.1 TRAP transporter large permease subunit [Bacillus yapensis]